MRKKEMNKKAGSRIVLESAMSLIGLLAIFLSVAGSVDMNLSNSSGVLGITGDVIANASMNDSFGNESINEAINNGSINDVFNDGANESISNLSEIGGVNNSDEVILINNSSNLSNLNESTNESIDSGINESLNGTTNQEFNETIGQMLNNSLNETFDIGLNESINETINESFDILNNSLLNASNAPNNLSIKTFRGKIRLGEKVKWMKNVSLELPENVTIELPREAENVSVKKIENEKIENINVVIGGITGNIVIENEGGSLITKSINLLLNLPRRLMGFAVSGRVLDNENGINSEGSNIQVQLNDNATEYVIEYTTDAPQAFEKNTSYGKEVVISGPDGLNYTDVLSFVNISEIYNMGQESSIKVYWVENKSYVGFDAYDLNGNNKIDYLEWATPHLSNQTFEIILISKAEHLDENRTFIEDVYDYVKAQDNNWTNIPANDYLRITFENNLTSENDITIYAKSSSNGSVEVYEKDKSEKIADFGQISEAGEYRILLTSLSGSQGTFDLKVSGGNVEFDYVIDPQINPATEAGLVALYHFNNESAYGENDSLVYDFSGSGNNGTVKGSAFWNSSGGILGTGGYQFNDTSSYISVGYRNCPENMSYIDKLGGYCIDQYEASMPSANSTDMGNASDVAARDAPGTLAAISQAGVVPWVSVSANSARTACTNAGKHLCLDSEWLGAANLRGKVYNLPATLSAAPYKCVVDSGTYCLDHSYSAGEACNTGRNKTDGVSSCVSAEGAYDMIGNVWEWTNNTVNVINPLTNATGGLAGWYYYNGTGWATSTSSATVRYGNDGTYFPVNSTGKAALRGGGWSTGAYAGPFTAYLDYGPTDTNYYLGFRCCRAPS